LRNAICSRFVDVIDYDSGAPGHKSPGDRLTNAGSSAGHHNAATRY
jgi:hypothetical protein